MPGTAAHDAEARPLIAGAEASVWTERMLSALVNGVKGGKWLVVSQFEKSGHPDDLHIKPAGVAREEIVLRIRRKGRDGGSIFVADPTTGALVVRPDLVDELDRAFAREMRRVKFRLDLQLALLYLAKFRLQCRYAAVKLLSYGSGFFR